MKKLIYVELAVLILLVLAILIVKPQFLKPTFSQDDAEQNKENVQQQPQEDQQTDEPANENLQEPEKIQIVPTWKTYPEDRVLTAKQYFVYDVQAGTFLTCSGKETERLYPASITKLFTAYVALQYLPLDKTITATDALSRVTYDSSVAGITEGDVLTVEKLVEAMLLPSGNDAAYILAVETARTMAGKPDMEVNAAVKAFVKEMNRLAKELGMTGTHFFNPDGIHDVNHYSTLADMVIVGKLALQTPTIAKYAAKAEDSVQLQEGTMQWKNTNALVDPASEYYCPYAVGLKTGQTFSAGSCLLSAFQAGQQQWLIGVFGCAELDDRFDDTLQLFNKTVLAE